jgi:hypothetical protein
MGEYKIKQAARRVKKRRKKKKRTLLVFDCPHSTMMMGSKVSHETYPKSNGSLSP